MRHLLLIPILVFAIASSLIFFCGDSGVLAFRSLDAYKRSLAANVESLQQRNRALTAELSSLRDDPERSIVLARDLGLYRSGDEAVKLVGVARRSTLYTVGDLLRMRKPSDTRSAIFKGAAVGLAVLLLAYAVISARGAAVRRGFGPSRGRAHGSDSG
jgi:cell division protein FtsB